MWFLFAYKLYYRQEMRVFTVMYVKEYSHFKLRKFIKDGNK